jgi:O-antigen/teichoic acid export membrane protein
MGASFTPEPENPGEETEFGAAARLLLLRQSLLNIGGPALTGIIGLILVPVMLRGLGAEVYGLWLMIVAVAGSAAAVADLGVSWSVIREVASSGGIEDGGEAARLVCTAANFYFALAMAGAALIVALGLPAVPFVPASLRGMADLRPIFMLAAVGFVAGQMFNFQLVVLQGLRRFELSNLLSLCSVLAGGLATIMLIELGGGLLSIMEAQAASSALSALAAYQVVISIRPAFRQHPGRIDWDLLSSRMPFSLGMQFTSLFSVITWESAPLLIGWILGPLAVSCYQIGSKFPAAVAGLLWPVAAVIFPAASANQMGGDANAADALNAGSRWVSIAALPVCIVLFILAPDLLQAWLRFVPRGSIAVLRLMTVAVMLHALSMSSIAVLMARGAVRILLLITGCQALAVTAFTVALLPTVGVEGAAWGFLLPMPVTAAILLAHAARNCAVVPGRIFRQMLAGQVAPAAACALATFIVLHACEPARTFAVIMAALAGAAAYAGIFYLWTASEEERMLLRSVLWLSPSASRQNLTSQGGLARRLGN